MKKRVFIAVTALLALTLVLSVAATYVRARMPLPGPFDLARASVGGLKFSQPPTTYPSTLDQDQVEAIVKQRPGWQRATEIRYQFLLLTTLDSVGATQSAQRDPLLAADLQQFGHPVNLPVWVVSLEGVDLVGTMGGVNHEHNIVLDAHTGEVLFYFTYR